MSVQEQVGSKELPAGDLSAGAGWADGRYLPVDEITIPILDHGFLKCDACYDTPHVWQGMFFRLDDHLDRFEASCRGLKLDPGLSRDEITEIMQTCATRRGHRQRYKANQPGDADGDVRAFDEVCDERGHVESR